MKKLFRMLFIATAMLALSISAATTVFANDSISVLIDGQAINFADQQPVIVDDRVLVPVRDVFETIGFDVDWNESTETILLSSSDGVFNIAIEIGAPYFSVGIFNPDSLAGHAVIIPLDVPAQIIGGRTLLPLRALLEQAGYQLDWIPETHTVLIATQTAYNRVSRDAVVNIVHLLGANLDSVSDLLGIKTNFDPYGKNITYYFDTGLVIGADEIGTDTIIMSVWIDFNEVDNRFHFNGINGDSSLNDVIALFGSEPYSLGGIYRDSASYINLGAVLSHGYFVDGRSPGFVRFFMDEDNRVVGISFFV